MYMQVLEITAIVLGLLLALWGLFHQLIVGGAVMIFEELSERAARLFIMSWVAQGAFMSFSGILIVVTLFFHGWYEDTSLTICSLTGIALLLLGLHVLFSGYKTHLKPIRIGAILEFVTGAVLLIGSISQAFM